MQADAVIGALADAPANALADALADTLADALADDSVKASVNSMGTGSGSVGSVRLTVALHAHSVRPAATHSGQYVAKGFRLFDAISTRWNEDARSARKRNTE